MRLLRRSGFPSLWHVATALVAAGILHIGATFAHSYFATSTAYQRLAAELPMNAMKVLPPVTPSTQPLAFLGADARYAMCRVDTAEGPVSLDVRLPEPGWALTLTSPAGETLYAASGQPDRAVELALKIVPSDERFMGLTPEARGIAADAVPLVVAARSGLVVLRAPDKGFAYRDLIEAELRRARCAPLSQPAASLGPSRRTN
jgi:uncharacterized membrane protein